MTPDVRRRINHWSPWGDDNSGITNYSEHLVPALAELVDVTLVHPTATDARYRVRRPHEVAGPSLDQADVNVFHLGNNLAFHHWMLGPILRHGGVVILHDWCIFDMVRPLFYRSLHLWERELVYNGETDMKLQLHRNDPGFLMAHPLNRRYLMAADVVVTHTEWVRDHAKSLYPDLDVRYIPLAGPSLPRQPVERNAPFTVLGGIGRHKKIEWAIDAFAKVEREYPAARLRIVGRGDDVYEIQRLKEQAARLGVAPRVEWCLDVDRATYLRLLGESLFVITLREETAGEMSGVMVEAWGAGRVTVTSDQPQFALFDERFCRRLPLGPTTPDQLADIMRDALRHPDAYEEAGRVGWELINEEFSFPRVASRHAALVDEVAERHGVDVTSGVNVFGSWGSSSGLTEVVRRLADSMLDAKIPITMPAGFTLEDYNSDLVPTRFATVPRTLTYAINLITANINEFHVVDPAVFGSAHERRWNIGLWIYEFPEIPAVLSTRMKLVDEIWTGSEFAAAAFRRYFDGPIMKLHNIVRVREQSTPADEVRARFGVRPTAVAVLFSFDFRSGWSRKNPLAVVRAFRDAVAAEPDVDAQLVMKVSGLTPTYRAILEAELATTDGVLIDAHLSDAEIGDLFHAVDVYCSLHRCEGFGLGMAESMAIGKTVIGTNYSGNVDFMTDTNSLLVDCTQTRVRAADTEPNPGLERIVKVGTRWAEPSHEAAVFALRQSFDPAVRSRLGAQAALDLTTQFSGEVATGLITHRLAVLREELRAFHTNWTVPTPDAR